MTAGAERRRLEEAREGVKWRWWGPYLAARQWGTVREDYSADGDAWAYFPHDHARSRAYRWGEDGLGGICDRWQHVCLALALWNGNDPILKERLFGLTNAQGNHGEDVKEYWWALDSTPTHSFMRWLYKYPQAAFPYERLVEENARRTRLDPEFELVDTGVFDGGRCFDVELTYAKAAPDDLCLRIDVTNHGPDAAPLHVLPTVWFRNTWAWGRDDRHPELTAGEGGSIAVDHGTAGQLWLRGDGGPELLFCDNETNTERLWGTPNAHPYPKDGINDHVIAGAPTVNPAMTGTKAAAWYRLDVPAGATTTLRLRLGPTAPAPVDFGPAFDETVALRQAEADDFYADLAPNASGEPARVARRAAAGLLWAKKLYRYDVHEWLEGDPTFPPPAPARAHGRNAAWKHLYNADVISMPDEWEYPWYAAWDLAFHMLTMAYLDADFAKQQLILFCREWFMHPNGQLPAYEWSFGDVNPPVHAWAAWRVYKIDASRTGVNDYEFLERIFHKLLINFSWWVNRKDADGSNVFEGGFLGLDNIGVFDRSAPLPSGARLEQSDATSWMAMFCLNMLAIALELAHYDSVYEDAATKFFEHFLAIAHAINNIGEDNVALWDETDGFFYDVLSVDGEASAIRIRSVVGLIPLFAVETMDPTTLEKLPDFARRMQWYIKNRPDLCDNIFEVDVPGQGERRLLSLVDPDRLRRLLTRALDTEEFLSPHGIRSVSKWHAAHPVMLDLAGVSHTVEYEPAESRTYLFGGNSNWRGPVWFPINYLLIESLQKYHHYLGDAFTVELPTGSGQQHTLWEVGTELSRRLTSIFLPDADGRRPVNGGNDLFDTDAGWRDHMSFHEYFHGDTGAGLGASHQTGWTALVAKLIRQSGR